MWSCMVLVNISVVNNVPLFKEKQGMQFNICGH
jgi:hypothetical protein